MLINTKKVTGFTLQSRDGEIGKVKEFYFDDKHWTVRYLVADTGTWLKERLVLLSPYALLSVDADKKQVSVDLTRKQIEGSPALDTDKPVSKQFEESYYGYYGWPFYWTGSHIWGLYPVIVPDPQKQPDTNSNGKSWDPHLRSTSGVHGYHIQATDGEIGHIKDYIINDETWEILYMVVDTRNWIPGRTVLISPKWVSSVSWDESKVFVSLTRDAVMKSPEYSEDDLPTRDYETRLHGHYNREGYWVDK